MSLAIHAASPLVARRMATRVRPGGGLRRVAGAAGRAIGRVVAGGPGVRRRRRRRAKGISGTELRGFRKVARLLASFGMRPRGLAGTMRRGGRRPFR